MDRAELEIQVDGGKSKNRTTIMWRRGEKQSVAPPRKEVGVRELDRAKNEEDRSRRGRMLVGEGTP